MNHINSDILRKITEKSHTLIAVSPHLDDAILSAGGLLLTLKGKNQIVNITIFTSPASVSSSLSVKAFLSQCKYPSAEALFEDRRSEDKEVFSTLLAESYHLNQVDALWRQIENPGSIRKILAKILPEFTYTYPIYRLDVISGKVSPKDQNLIERTSDQIKTIVKKYSSPIILCPLGIGSNVDHILTRDLCKSTFKDVIYWSDQPYALSNPIDKQFIESNDLVEFSSDYGIEENNELVKGYKTQYKALFPDGIFPKHQEVFYFSSNLASEILTK